MSNKSIFLETSLDRNMSPKTGYKNTYTVDPSLLYKEQLQRSLFRGANMSPDLPGPPTLVDIANSCQEGALFMFPLLYVHRKPTVERWRHRRPGQRVTSLPAREEGAMEVRGVALEDGGLLYRWVVMLVVEGLS